MSKNVESCRILADNITVSNNTWITGLNNNDLLVGPSGAGKTRGYVVPNILHTGDNLIVADTKGNLSRIYGPVLAAKGYKIMHLNFKDVARSEWGYNPLDYIRQTDDPDAIRNGDRYSEQDIRKVAQAICPCLDQSEPFWDLAAQMYLETILLYVLNRLPAQQHTLYEAYTFLSRMNTPEIKSMIREEYTVRPDSAFARKILMVTYNCFAEKMDASIRGILARHLDAVAYPAMRRFFTLDNQIDMGAFLHGKTALFLSISDSDRSMDAIANLYYTQALQFLLDAADQQPDSRLPIPVRFILDDFATGTLIPDFDKIVSVIRSREIYVSLIVQSLSQLEGLYGESRAQTIVNNCDTCLYLGGTDVRTADYFAGKLNVQRSTVLNLPLDRMYLFVRGSEPRRIRKYDLDSDSAYKALVTEMERKTQEGGAYESQR